MAIKSKEKILAESNDMTPVAGTVEIDIPIKELWESFTHANWWARWNKCFFWALNKDLVLGKQLIWCFQPIRWWYLYKMPAIAKIVEVEKEKKVTWEVSALPGFYARHTYHMEDLGNGRSRFGSWEKATGWSFRLMKWFWVAHFTFVKDLSLEGAKHLEDMYSKEKKIDGTTLKPKRYWPFWGSVIFLLLVFVGAAFGGWLYTSFVRQTTTELAPGIHVVFGGGGNSLIVQDGEDVLVVDTKFPPGSEKLHGWLSERIGKPVTKIVNTHYHYDHTQGNILYPQAQIYAHRKVPELMSLRDRAWWSQQTNGIPDGLIADIETLKVGRYNVVLTHSGLGHTHGDLWVYLPKQNIVATGDLVSHSYYPFFDLGEGGASIPDMIKIIRNLANQYPDAVFVPGHGSLAKAEDLLGHADYLEFLYTSVETAHEEGLSEAEALRKIDLSQWDRSILPSFQNNELSWATAKNNIRWVYQLLKKSEA